MGAGEDRSPQTQTRVDAARYWRRRRSNRRVHCTGWTVLFGRWREGRGRYRGDGFRAHPGDRGRGHFAYIDEGGGGGIGRVAAHVIITRLQDGGRGRGRGRRGDGRLGLQTV